MTLTSEEGHRLYVLSLLERGQITTAQAAEGLLADPPASAPAPQGARAARANSAPGSAGELSPARAQQGGGGSGRKFSLTRDSP